jgi:hypothetical protein
MTDSALTASATVEPTRFGEGADDAAVPERRPGDVAWLVVALIGVVLCALWSGANGDTNENL